MKSVGVRELRQRATAVLRQVETGAAIAVTSRGRIVAKLVPIRQAGTRERLIAQGRLVPGSGDLLDLGAPVRAKRGTALPGGVLAEAREHER